MDKSRIKVVSNIPGLADKLTSNLEGSADLAKWYMKFNIPLDPATVNHRTMMVTDTEGYIMETEISYQQRNNAIVISPLNSYEENRYYILSVSKQVCSAKGQNLKRKIYIMFKLMNNQISEFQLLKSTVNIPVPKRRPPDYDQRQSRMKKYSISDKAFEGVEQYQLPLAPLKVTIIPGLVGVALVGGSIFMGGMIYILASSGLALASFVFLVFQLTRKKNLSTLNYNRGVRCFNKEQYQRAAQLFQKAFDLDPTNEMAEYAVNKVSFYNT